MKTCLRSQETEEKLLLEMPVAAALTLTSRSLREQSQVVHLECLPAVQLTLGGEHTWQRLV